MRASPRDVAQLNRQRLVHALGDRGEPGGGRVFAVVEVNQEVRGRERAEPEDRIVRACHRRAGDRQDRECCEQAERAQLSASFLSDASSVSASIGVMRLMSTSRSRDTSRSSAGEAAENSRAAAAAPAGRCR